MSWFTLPRTGKLGCGTTDAWSAAEGVQVYG